MTPDQHALYLGKLIANLQSLEIVLRFCLYEKQSAPHAALAHGASIEDFNIGDVIPLNALTDYSQLRNLIARYNEIVADDSDLVVDSTLADLRDALAHGRISSATPTSNYTLMKFSAASENQVTVTYRQEMSHDWFETERKRVVSAIARVAKTMGQPIPQFK